MRTLAPKLPRPRDISPWADQTPVRILEREYALPDLVYTTGSAQIVKQYINMFSQTAFKNAMSTFRYIRWDFVEWRYQIMSVPQVWGAVGFTCLPLDARRSGSNLESDYGILSHSDCQIADFSTANSGRIMVPWSSLNKWLDILLYTEEAFTGDQFNELKIVGGPWIYSADSSIPKSVTINLWCSLHGVQVAGPRIANTVNAEGEAEMQAGVAGVLYSAMQTELTKYLATSGVQHLKNAAQAGFHQVDEVLGDWFDFDDPTHAQEQGGETGGTAVIPDIYGNLNFSAPRCLLGVGSQILPSRAPKHSWLDFIMMPTFWGHGEFTTTSSQIDLLGWPFFPDVDDLTEDITPRCNRLDFASQFFRMWRGSFEYTIMMVSSPLVVQKVGVAISYTDTSGTVGDIVTEVIEVKGTTIHKVLVPYLYTNPYQYIQDSSVNNVAGPGERPRVRLFLYSTPKAAGDTVPVMKILIWQNACSDFKFYSPRCPQYQKEYIPPEPAVFMQTSIKSFSNIKPSRQFEVIENDVPFWPDQTITMEQLCQRWSCRTTPDPDALRELHDHPPWQWNTADCIRSLFFYNRGQYKVKMTFSNPEDVPYTADQGLMAKMDPRSRFTYNDVPEDFARINDGVQVISFGLTQLLEYTVPWYSNSEWMATFDHDQGVYAAKPERVGSFLQAIGNTNPDTTPAPSFCATSMGPDFALALQLPPPYYGYRWYLTTEPPPPEPVLRVQTPSKQQRVEVVGRTPSDKDPRKIEIRKKLSSQDNLKKTRGGQ